MSNVKNINNILVKNDISGYDDLNINDRLPFEIFIPITDSIIQNIRDGYYISNYARVYDRKRNVMVPKNSWNGSYYNVNIMLKNGNSKKVLLHRLLMLSFNYIPGCEELYVNHIDGNKQHCSLSNLEWVTASENMIHASSHKLLKPSHGEEHVCSTITYEQAENICRLLESRKYRNTDIAKMVGCSVSIVNDIRSGKSWKDVSIKYKLNYNKERVSTIFTFDELHSICKYFEDHPKPIDISLREYIRNALIYNGIDDVNESKLNSIRKLYKREHWSYIYEKYNY